MVLGDFWLSSFDFSGNTPPLDRGLNYRSLRAKVKSGKLSEVLLTVPDLAHLLGQLLLDSRVKRSDKIKIGLVSAYIISPLDLVPKLMGIGLIDDLALIAWALNSVMKNTPAEVLREHWTGKGDVVDKINQAMRAARLLLRIRPWRSLRPRI